MAPSKFTLFMVPVDPPSCVGDAAVYVFDINQSSLPAPFYSVLVFVSVFMALSNVFLPHKIFRQLSDFSLWFSVLMSALLVFSAINLFMKVSHSPDTTPCSCLGLKYQLNNYPYLCIKAKTQ